MTYREKLKMECPERVDPLFVGGCIGCPYSYGYDDPDNCMKNCDVFGGQGCTYCWDRESPDMKETVERLQKAGESLSLGYKEGIEYTDPDIRNRVRRVLDSGNRRQFESGAVRDICEGKGRCDLLPLDVVALVNGCGEDSHVIRRIDDFRKDGMFVHLCGALEIFTELYFKNSMPSMFLEVSRQFEDGAKKYGEDNWQKGIPTHCYIDSAVRHYLKYLRGDTDEPHDRAFCWNILCCIWTCIHKPELNDYRKEETNEANR